MEGFQHRLMILNSLIISLVGFINISFRQFYCSTNILLVDKIFDETHNLWEKYNVINGSIDVVDEYKMPTMMGWSAGVYLAADHFLENGTIF